MPGLDGAHAGLFGADLVGAGDNEIVLGGEDDVAVFADDFGPEVPKRRFSRALGELQVDDSFPRGSGGDGNQC